MPDVQVSSIHDVLEQYRKVSFDQRDKGTHFELLMQAFLKTEPQYAELYDEVWGWEEYPSKGTRTDTGVDLVARNRDTGELTAIQCKFFSPTTTVTKGMLDSFLSASGKMNEDGSPEFASRLVISTSDLWGKNAEDAITGQSIPVERLRVQDLDESSIDWSQFVWDEPRNLIRHEKKKPFPYQEAAISDVIGGFAAHDRGKLIMACGTGKTYTSLRLAERTAPLGGTVLFLVPSIALLSQTLKEWTIQAEVPLRSFAVCSDVSVGKRRTEEDIPVRDLAFPATTNASALIKQLSQGDASEKLTVIFSTYQSLAVISKAQEQGLPQFDLIICDEAHRTTGAALTDEDESAFMKIHNQSFVQGKKRIYMTATPRIFSDGTRKKAGEVGAKLADMDDESVYGPEFHRLGFGQAVSMGRLTDYKVLVLAVDEGFVSREFQSLMSSDGYELKMEDTAKIVGTWNGLSKRSVNPDEYDEDPAPMQRAVMFAQNIATSKKLSNAFQQVVEGEIERLEAAGEDTSRLLHAEADHVDGTQSMLVRNGKIDWLKEASPENTVRILSNAKCLSEGVDVPALDAVMFMNPRKSVVDVVQSVGRVMRKMVGKKYGYVILPIAVPSDVSPEQALNNNEKYRVVWQVLQALRAHDERFDAEVNKIDLTKKTDRLKIDLIGVGGSGDRDEDEAVSGNDKVNTSLQLDFSKIEAWRDAILSKIVQKVGTRTHWENWAKDVADIARAHTKRINGLISSGNPRIAQEFEAFTEGLRLNLNPEISHDDAVQMLSQHLITQPVFNALFEGYEFSQNNPVSQVMNAMVSVLDGENLENETEKLEEFYASVQLRAQGIDDAAAKQTIVKELYEKFFSTAFSKTSEKLGIVYTPNEIVDFIIHSVNDVLKEEFDATLSDEGIHVLDPFTGTGTFIVRLLQSGLIKPHDLARKYRYELHANEIVLLAYYVAAINIEETYHSLQGGLYIPFDGIVLTDTFQMHEDDDELDNLGVFQKNNERVIEQKKRDIRVIIGNPPYSKGQTSGNDDNANNTYPTLDEHIRSTYAERSTATNKNNLYDSYIRSIRWASDRIGNEGVIGYVSNGGYIDGNTADGLRKTLVEEFSNLYIFNLRGNQRTSGEKSRQEGGKVFGGGSRATIAIAILVKNPRQTLPGQLYYYDIGDYLTREQKLEKIQSLGSIAGVPWRQITPSPEGDWLNMRNDDFAKFAPLGEKDKAKSRETRVFDVFGRGLETGRDAWVYNYSLTELEGNASRLISNYNAELDRWIVAGKPTPVDGFITADTTAVKWSRSLRGHLAKSRKAEFEKARTQWISMYRPFAKQHVYFDGTMNHERSQLPRFFPEQGAANLGIYYVGMGSAVPFSVLMLDCIPDLHVTGAGSGGQFFPRFTYRRVEQDPTTLFPDSGMLDVFEQEETENQLDFTTTGYERLDNITDEILTDYQEAYGKVSKDDIFYYVYGLLHSREYRAEFDADLKKMLPRIPKVRAFKEFVKAGRALAELHLNYESVEPYPLTENAASGASLRVTKMRYAKNGRQDDKRTIIYNDDITLSGIPEEAQEYLLGSRSALDWVIERYQVKTDKASGIVNDPNAWCDEHNEPRYILDLIKRLTTVSVETVRIVQGLPQLEVIEP
ncbi:DEAD/DEAH box helicase [Leucobacter sp. HNU]|uniref:DEAD/DEAH box helicase n=1 Tax=Leucobacter sp. HNU TaxID=3236805 RepID=UPI003A80B0CC